jgi:hypothetical protein
MTQDVSISIFPFTLYGSAAFRNRFACEIWRQTSCTLGAYPMETIAVHILARGGWGSAAPHQHARRLPLSKIDFTNVMRKMLM